MHVRNTFDWYVCLELGILVRPVFTNILFACLLEHGLIIQNHLFAYLLFEIWFYNLKPLLACLLFEIWFFNLKPLLACLFFFKVWLNKSKPFTYFLFTYGLKSKPFTCLLNSLFAFQTWFTIKTIKYQCKTVYNIIH